MTQNEQLNDLYTEIRGIQVPKIQVKQIEDTYGVKLVSDDEALLIQELDLTLQKHRLTHDNKDPDLVVLYNYPGELFKHMVLNINFLGLDVPGPYNKPAWFRFKKNHPIRNNINKQKV